MNQLSIAARRLVRGVAVVTVLAFGLSAGPVPIQSPIDIRSENSVYALMDALEFSYSSDTPIQVENNGSPGLESTIKGLVPSGAGSLMIAGTMWPLLQFHFHTESEHGLNGAEFDMELHMVHQLPSGEYLVVGRWIEVGAFNASLDPIFSDLPPAAGDIFDLPSFDLTALLPSDLRSYRYTGSLTTSPYTEGVNWVMLHERLELSADQVAAFRALFPAGNEREWQDLNGRMIETDVAGFSSVPEPSTTALLGLGVVLIVGRAGRLTWARRRKG